jgi:hypothetical protein
VHDPELKTDLEAFVADRKAARAAAGPSANGAGAGGGVGDAGAARGGKAPTPRPKPPRPTQPKEPTLLKRLLGLEKDKEAQLVLEAIRFLAQNRFLQGGS